MSYLKYRKSRNLAWQLLLDNKVSKLPVKVSIICSNLGIPVINYKSGAKLIHKMNLEKFCKESDGFTFQGQIFYNSECSIKRQRFTVAHELGHILLHDGIGTYNREPTPNDTSIEHEANIFASRLLAPACVLWGLNIHSADEISEVCNISLISAQFRAERLEKLYAREREFIRLYNKSCFLQSSLERQVFNNFKSFIENYKSSLS